MLHKATKKLLDTVVHHPNLCLYSFVDEESKMRVAIRLHRHKFDHLQSCEEKRYQLNTQKKLLPDGISSLININHTRLSPVPDNFLVNRVILEEAAWLTYQTTYSPRPRG